jgi:hypothetical protein
MASILKVDDLRGNTAAGNITITSEGGAATMQLQQGLAKSWANFNGTGTIALTDSFNVASLSDEGTGEYETNFTNSMNNGDFAIHVTSDANSSNDGFNRTAGGSNNTTAKGHARHYEAGSITDTSLMITTVHGDLA